jgi:hypothetical protein
MDVLTGALVTLAPVVLANAASPQARCPGQELSAPTSARRSASSRTGTVRTARKSSETFRRSTRLSEQPPPGRRVEMGKVSKDATGEPIEGPGFEGRYGETEGYTIGFEKYSEHADMTPLFVGLPDDRCQSPHWGYVFKGKLVYHTADGDIEVTDGEAYYVGPGHAPEIFPDTEIVEFSPTADFRQTMDVVGKNMESIG